MTERIPNSEHQNLNHFISDSPWDGFGVMDTLSEQQSERFSGFSSPKGLLFDESGWEKSGKKSVGVARQYIGQVGKVCNGQVGVFAALSCGTKVGLLQGRLYLPHEWVDDEERCLQAGIPKKEIFYRSKPELAIEIHKNLPSSVTYDWVGGDSIYGSSPGLRYHLEDTKTCFVMDIAEDFGLFLQNPQPFIPEKQGKKGRTPVRYHSDSAKVLPKDLLKEVEETAWQTITHRQGTKGNLTRKAVIFDVFVWTPERKDRVEILQLIISTEPDGSEVKYSLGYDPNGKMPLNDGLCRQMQRYWVERAFQNVKEQLGMQQYQVRSWKAWYHHIALSLLAMDFILSIQIENEDQMPLLSCADVKLIFARTLLNKLNSQEGLLLAIQNRHKVRQNDIRLKLFLT